MAPLASNVLPAHDVDTTQLGLHLKSKKEIPTLFPLLRERDIKLVVIAVPVGGILLSEHIADGTVIVDMGQGLNPEETFYAGNAHPGLVARHDPYNTNGGVKVNGLRKSGGLVTTAIAFDRTIPDIGAFAADHFRPNRSLATIQ
jgi:hypothetical protein